jgi:hypothetical protein
MDTWKIGELRRRVERGEPVELNEVRALIVALEATRSQVSLPAEFVVRVHRNDSLRWQAERRRWRSGFATTLSTVGPSTHGVRDTP